MFPSISTWHREDRQDTALTSQLRINMSPCILHSVHFQSCTHLPELMALNYVNCFGLGQCTQFRHLHNSLHFLPYWKAFFSRIDTFRKLKVSLWAVSEVIFIWTHILSDLFYFCCWNILEILLNLQRQLQRILHTHTHTRMK